MPRRTAPATKTSASRTARPATPVRKAAPAKKTAPARKTAAPAARRAPAVKPAEAAPKAPAVKKTLPVQAHDVARAQRDVIEAQVRLEAITKAYWAEHGILVQGAVDHVAAIAELDGPPRQGAPKHDGPQQKALARDPQVGEYYDLDAVHKMSLPELRELARDLASRGVIQETMKKTVILTEMEEAGLFREEESSSSHEDDLEEDDSEGSAEDGEDEDGEDEYEDDDESDEDDEGAEDDDAPTLEEIEDAKLSQLRAWCEEYQIRTAKKSADDLREALIAKLGLEVEDEAEEEEDEDGEEYDEDAEDGEDEDDEGYLTVADAKKMNLVELQRAATDCGEKVPASTFKSEEKLRAWVIEYLESLDEEEDDDEE